MYPEVCNVLKLPSLKTRHSQILSPCEISSRPRGRYLNPVCSCKNRLAFHFKERQRVSTVPLLPHRSYRCGLLIHISGSNFPIRSGRKKKNKEWQLAPEQHEVRNRRWDFEIETHSCSPYAERHQGGILFLKGEHFNVEVESLTMLSVCSVCKKELLKNNIPFKRCSTLKLSMVKVETP